MAVFGRPRDSVYVSYDSNAGRLYFDDGSFWVMGCMSAGTEMDAGSMYPTVIEDTNGNQVFFRYQPGQGLLWRDSSARIAQIEDVRAVAGLDGYSTYNFVYDGGPVVPHLVNVLSSVGTAELYTFALGGMQALNDPFGGASFGSTYFLQSVTLPISGLHYQFESNSWGGLTKVTFPYRGYLRWDYVNWSYTGGRQQPEIANRYMFKAAGQSDYQYPLGHEANDGTQSLHYLSGIDDPGGVGNRVWWFSPSGATRGLLTSLERRRLPERSVVAVDEYTWTQDPAGRWYCQLPTTLWAARRG